MRIISKRLEMLEEYGLVKYTGGLEVEGLESPSRVEIERLLEDLRDHLLKNTSEEIVRKCIPAIRILAHMT